MNLKRVFAGVAAAATALGTLAIGAATANAASLTGSKETITINEALAGQEFQAYQLATFTDATGANGVINDLAMSTPTAANTALNDAITTLNNADPTPAGWTDVDLTAANVVDNNLALLVTTLSSSQLRVLAKQLAGSGLNSTHTATVAPGATSATITGLQPGWYLVTCTSGAKDAEVAPAIMPSTVTGYTSIAQKPSGTITLGELNVKMVVPTPHKTIGANDPKVLKVGDTLHYTITSTLPAHDATSTVKYHYIIDTPGLGLTVDNQDGKNIQVNVNDTPLNADQFVVAAYKNATLNNDTHVLTGKAEFPIDGNADGTNFFLVDLTAYATAHPELAGKKVTVTYTATVNGDALDTVSNKVNVGGDDPTDWRGTEEITRAVSQLQLKKVGVEDTGAAGAQFQLTDDNNSVLKFVKHKDGTTGISTYTYDPNGSNEEVESQDDGSIVIYGLPAGRYKVTETKVLDNYSPNFKAVFNADVAQGTDVTSASWKLASGDNLLGLATQATQESGTAPIQVKNVKSITQLPLTGAAGITMLVVVALLIGGAAALIAVRSHSLKQQLRG